jgi:hypothetical protein
MIDEITKVANEAVQPRGGYLPASKYFSKAGGFMGSLSLVSNEQENLHNIIVGLAVEHTFKYVMTNRSDIAFKSALRGASKAGLTSKAQSVMSEFDGSLVSLVRTACKMSGFDVCSSKSMEHYSKVDKIVPSSATIENIRIMVDRLYKFYSGIGTVEFDASLKGSYTDKIRSGGINWISNGILWDFKVTKNAPSKEDTLQSLIRYIMGQKSYDFRIHVVEELGIANPRTGLLYFCKVRDIEAEIIESVSREVIGYK